MSGVGRFLEMSRHERRGVVALLVVCFVAVGVLWWAAARPREATAGELREAQRFAVQADSLRAVEERQARLKQEKREAAKQKRAAKKATSPRSGSKRAQSPSKSHRPAEDLPVPKIK